MKYLMHFSIDGKLRGLIRMLVAAVSNPSEDLQYFYTSPMAFGQIVETIIAYRKNDRFASDSADATILIALVDAINVGNVQVDAAVQSLTFDDGCSDLYKSLENQLRVCSYRTAVAISTMYDQVMKRVSADPRSVENELGGSLSDELDEFTRALRMTFRQEQPLVQEGEAGEGEPDEAVEAEATAVYPLAYLTDSHYRQLMHFLSIPEDSAEDGSTAVSRAEVAQLRKTLNETNYFNELSHRLAEKLRMNFLHPELRTAGFSTAQANTIRAIFHAVGENEAVNAVEKAIRIHGPVTGRQIYALARLGRAKKPGETADQVFQALLKKLKGLTSDDIKTLEQLNQFPDMRDEEKYADLDTLKVTLEEAEQAGLAWHSILLTKQEANTCRWLFSLLEADAACTAIEKVLESEVDYALEIDSLESMVLPFSEMSEKQFNTLCAPLFSGKYHQFFADRELTGEPMDAVVSLAGLAAKLRRGKLDNRDYYKSILLTVSEVRALLWLCSRAEIMRVKDSPVSVLQSAISSDNDRSMTLKDRARHDRLKRLSELAGPDGAAKSYVPTSIASGSSVSSLRHTLLLALYCLDHKKLADVLSLESYEKTYPELLRIAAAMGVISVEVRSDHGVRDYVIFLLEGSQAHNMFERRENSLENATYHNLLSLLTVYSLLVQEQSIFTANDPALYEENVKLQANGVDPESLFNYLRGSGARESNIESYINRQPRLKLFTAKEMPRSSGGNNVFVVDRVLPGYVMGNEANTAREGRSLQAKDIAGEVPFKKANACFVLTPGFETRLEDLFRPWAEVDYTIVLPYLNGNPDLRTENIKDIADPQQKLSAIIRFLTIVKQIFITRDKGELVFKHPQLPDVLQNNQEYAKRLVAVLGLVSVRNKARFYGYGGYSRIVGGLVSQMQEGGPYVKPYRTAYHPQHTIGQHRKLETFPIAVFYALPSSGFDFSHPLDSDTKELYAELTGVTYDESNKPIFYFAIAVLSLVKLIFDSVAQNESATIRLNRVFNGSLIGSFDVEHLADLLNSPSCPRIAHGDIVTMVLVVAAVTLVNKITPKIFEENSIVIEVPQTTSSELKRHKPMSDWVRESLRLSSVRVEFTCNHPTSPVSNPNSTLVTTVDLPQEVSHSAGECPLETVCFPLTPFEEEYGADGRRERYFRSRHEGKPCHERSLASSVDESTVSLDPINDASRRYIVGSNVAGDVFANAHFAVECNELLGEVPKHLSRVLTEALESSSLLDELVAYRQCKNSKESVVPSAMRNTFFAEPAGEGEGGPDNLNADSARHRSCSI